MFLKVDQFHNIHYETYGIEDCIPVLFIHGGPGLGYSQSDKRFFDPTKHFVIFYDQRGCGQSTPIGCLDQNKPVFLIEDIVKLLDHLKIQKVNIYGGSWGATLAVLFAAQHPQRVKSLVLRGFFSATKSTIDLYLKGGNNKSHPNAWARVMSFVPEDQKQNLAQYYFDKISNNTHTSEKLAYEWSRYGLTLSKKNIEESQIEQIMVNYEDASFKICIELYYALNYFFIEDGYVFNQAELIKAPTTIIHGSQDYLCPVYEAEILQSIIKGSKLVICNAGHSASEPIVENALKEAISNYS